MAEAVSSIDSATWRTWRQAGRAAQLIDVRSPSEFAGGHLPGAINIPLEQVELRVADLAPESLVVLVCQAGSRARMAAGRLAALGRSSLVLEGGTDAWVRAGEPVVRAVAARWSLERQVRLTAGLLVAAGIAAGVLLSPWALVVPAFVGCGLAMAGLTGLCPMASLLARLPWNRPLDAHAPAAPSPAAPGPVAGGTCALPARQRQ